jgi:predicted ATP-binding protein involved in virulence
MEDIFIKKIRINYVQHIQDFEIPISETERKHLILTGKNGSGKTSVLKAIWQTLKSIKRDIYTKIDFSVDSDTAHNALNVDLSVEKIYFSTDRKAKYQEYDQNLKFDPTSAWSSDYTYQFFIQYLTELKIQASLEKTENDGNAENANRINDWFDFLTNKLQDLFQSPNLHLKFVWKPSYQLLIREEGKSFNFNQMPDGYTSLMAIVAELILRSFHEKINPEIGLQGIVMIDEIENHLHIDLQKKILPFLTSFFPNIQFIVTTHSPFVINSISNAVICDLEKMEVIQEDLSSYSYETIVEGYFGSDQYSDVLKRNLEEFELLSQKNNKTDIEIDKYLKLRNYLKDAPKLFSEELSLKIHQIEQQQFKKSA